MTLKEIAAIAGKGGLFKVVKPTRTGVILESIDEQKNRVVASAQNRVSLLKEISIYTTGKESSVPLQDVLIAIRDKYGNDIPVEGKSSTEELAGFLASVVPDYDTQRVYASDMKKLATWYGILSAQMPELIQSLKKTEEETSEDSAKPEPENAAVTVEEKKEREGK